MDMSESIKELTAALAKAQGQFPAVPKTGRNTFLNSSYVTLDDIIAAIRGPLSQNGIAWTQPLTGNGGEFMLETLLLHESGEWMSCSAPIHTHTAKGLNALQLFGVALTYMRRYMLTAMLGINAEEDTDGDGKKPTASATKKPARKPAAKPAKKAATRKPASKSEPPPPASADPAVWDQLIVPENYTDLYYRVHELGVDDANAAGRRKHAAAIIHKTYPDNDASAADAWKAIIAYQRSKLADETGAQ